MSPPRHVVSHHRKVLPGHARPSKPPAIKTNRHSLTSQQSNKAGAGWSKTVGKKETSAEPDDEDMAGLPHFCAFCEKQIVTPGGSILYCSESCRRKDGSKPLSATALTSPLPSPGMPSGLDRKSYREIVPQRSHTLLRPSSIVSTDTSFFDIEPLSSRTESDASRYLAQFSTPSPSPERRRRPQYQRAQTSTPYSTLPSLSHTPASLASAASSFASTRALPLRTNTYGAPTSSRPRSIDLVTPLTGPSSFTDEQASLRSCASTKTAFPIAEGELSYQRVAVTESSPSSGSLKQLFSHDAMRRAPSGVPSRT